MDHVCIEGLILSNVKSSSDQNIRHANSCIPFVARFSSTSVRETEAVVKAGSLKYYRSLCQAVLTGKLPQVDPSKLSLELQRAKSAATITLDDKNF